MTRIKITRIILFTRSYRLNRQQIRRSEQAQRIAITFVLLIMLASIISWWRPDNTWASYGPAPTAGYGINMYSDNTTTPKVRAWANGNSVVGASGSTVASRQIYQTAIQTSPTTPDLWYAGVNDNAGNLDIVCSADGGTSWSIALAAATIGGIGGTGTTRRFDIAFERLSGELVLMYSKNATTNELGIRTVTPTDCSSSWSGETAVDLFGTASVITWVELAEKDYSNELALSYLTNASTGTNIGAAIWDGSAIVAGDWSSVYQIAETEIGALGYDNNNGAIYAGSATGGIFYKCSTSSGCDVPGDWALIYDSGQAKINGFWFDSTNSVMYAAADGDIRRCVVSTGCDTAAEWTTQTPNALDSQYYGFGYDAVNDAIYVSSGTAGRIFKCLITSTSCDATVDWVIAYDTAENIQYAQAYVDYDSTHKYMFTGSDPSGVIYRCDTYANTCLSGASHWTSYDLTADATVRTLAVDSTNNVIYAGTSTGGHIYRCALTSGNGYCDGAGDWTDAYDTSESIINQLFFDSANGLLYAGTGTTGIILRCNISSDCDVPGDWTEIFNTGSGSISAFTFDSANSVMYASLSSASGSMVLRCSISSGCDALGGQTGILGMCDQTAGTPDGVDKCLDVNYETATGYAVMTWGISGGGNTTNTIRASRWNGSTWATATINMGDDGTFIDCEADKAAGSTEILCVSYGASVADVQSWTVVAGALVGANANIDAAAHAASAGKRFVAATYLRQGGIRRGIVAFADASDDGLIDMSSYDGSAWTNSLSITTVAGAANEESLMAVTNPYDETEAFFLYADVSTAPSDLYMSRIKLNGTTLSSSDANGGAAVSTALVHTVGNAFDFAFEPPRSLAKYTQTGYIWENDDEDMVTGDVYDENTQQAAGNTAITGVYKGERLTLRSQITNNGYGPLRKSDVMGLFYDRGDGIWSKVEPGKTAVTRNGSGCGGGSSSWDCTLVEDTAIGGADSVGAEPSIAFDRSGDPWIAYYDTTNTNLRITRYTGGIDSHGCGGAGSKAWACVNIELNSGASEAVGNWPSLAFDKSDSPWVSYYDGTDGDLRVARYVGSGGTGCGGSSAVTWTCTLIEGTANVGQDSHLAFDTTGTPWISYFDITNDDVKVARFVGAGGSGCTGGSTAWTCMTVETGAAGSLLGYYTTIGFTSTGTAYISYLDYTGGTGNLRVAQYVGAGGSGCSGASTLWTCTLVEATNDVGHMPSIGFDASNTPWVASFDQSNGDLRVAKYTGTGTENTCGGGSSNWLCTLVESSTSGGDGNVGHSPSLAFDPSGTPWIAYYDPPNTDGSLRLARYVGSGGSGCTGGSSAWTCTEIEANSGSTEDVGLLPSLAFAPDGTPWIAYNDGTDGDLRVANMVRGGEINLVPAAGAKAGDTIAESHVDMTAVPNDGNRDDIDCVSGTWNNGRYIGNNDGSGMKLRGGGTAQCTEIAWTIDTSQATFGQTYRFIFATDDSMRYDLGRWRGPAAVTNYATLTIESVPTSARVLAAKDNMAKFTDCNPSTNWGCTLVDDPANNVGDYTASAMDPSGNMWIAYRDFSALSLKVARYVGGAAGTGCGSNSDWTCEVIDDQADSVGDELNHSLAFDSLGNAWIAYQNETDKSIWVAHYVGTGGTGCTASTNAGTWSCEAVDDHGSNAYGDFYISMAIDHLDRPFIAYQDNGLSDLRVAYYVGTAGIGCTSPSNPNAWQCGIVDGGAFNGGSYPFVLYNPVRQQIEIAYRNIGSESLKIARMTGNGGWNCNSSSYPEWDCETVYDTAEVVGNHTSMAVDSSGYLLIAHNSNTADYVMLTREKPTGTGDSTCTGATTLTNWTCETVYDPGAVDWTSIGVGPDGTVWIAMYEGGSQDLYMAKSVSSGGSGCTSATNSTLWFCEKIDGAAAAVGGYASLSIDHDGAPWISGLVGTSNQLKVFKLHLPTNPISYDFRPTGHFIKGLRGNLRYQLSSGYAPRSSSCSDVTDLKGTCGIATDDSDYDSITAKANERPMFTFNSRSPNNAAREAVITWKGRSNINPSQGSTTGDILLQVYQYGSTNAWVTLASDTASSDCNTVDCTVTATLAGDLSEYFVLNAQEAGHYISLRVWQYENSSTETLKTDVFSVTYEQTGQKMRHGNNFINGLEGGFGL